MNIQNGLIQYKNLWADEDKSGVPQTSHLNNDYRQGKKNVLYNNYESLSIHPLINYPFIICTVIITAATERYLFQ